MLLVTAMLIVPAVFGTHLARTAGGMFWWAIVGSLTSSVSGLALSVQPWLRTATGATIILVACAWFVLSILVASARNERR